VLINNDSVRIDVEEGEPVDNVEGQEEAGEDDKKHQIHPGSPHLVINL
jgi:hypothetical protein